nr:hypothetical protein [uncultured Chryseobacterium sp.]
MLKNFIIKNWKTIFNIQLTFFTAFIVLTFIYYWDQPAHQYFNRTPEVWNAQSIFSLIMTYLFVFFIAVAIIYPVLFIIQLLSVRRETGKGKKMILLLFFYLLSIISVFALFTIHNSQAIKAIH